MTKFKIPQGAEVIRTQAMHIWHWAPKQRCPQCHVEHENEEPVVYVRHRGALCGWFHPDCVLERPGVGNDTSVRLVTQS
jgi:hypothetical protein